MMMNVMVMDGRFFEDYELLMNKKVRELVAS